MNDAFNAWPYWPELALTFAGTSLGNILLGHFEPSQAKRVAKLFLSGALAVVVSATLGRAWFFGGCGVLLGAVAVIHGWWLPRHGVNGWTAEPKEKYYALRGWKLPEKR